MTNSLQEAMLGDNPLATVKLHVQEIREAPTSLDGSLRNLEEATQMAAEGVEAVVAAMGVTRAQAQAMTRLGRPPGRPPVDPGAQE